MFIVGRRRCALLSLSACAAWFLAPYGPSGFLLLLERDELQPLQDSTGNGRLYARLSVSDLRVKELMRQKGRDEAKRPRVGVVNGGIDESAELWWLSEAALRGSAEGRLPFNAHGIGQLPKRLRPQILEVQLDGEIPLHVLEPKVHLLLALPRPNRLKQMLIEITQLGICTIFLSGSASVEPRYFNSSLLEVRALRCQMMKGLALAGDTRMPKVIMEHDLQKLLMCGGELDRRCPRGTMVRLVAHPGDRKIPAMDIQDVPRPQHCSDAAACQVLLAVGPEAGWDDPAELELLKAAGFLQVSCGPRILRSDVAVVSLMALARDLLYSWGHAVANDS